LPFGILIFDYLENLSVLTLIMLMPSRYNMLATFAGYFTFTKWFLASLCLIIILIHIVRCLIKRKLHLPERAKPEGVSCKIHWCGGESYIL